MTIGVKRVHIAQPQHGDVRVRRPSSTSQLCSCFLPPFRHTKSKQHGLSSATHVSCNSPLPKQQKLSQQIPFLFRSFDPYMLSQELPVHSSPFRSRSLSLSQPYPPYFVTYPASYPSDLGGVPVSPYPFDPLIPTSQVPLYLDPYALPALPNLPYAPNPYEAAGYSANSKPRPSLGGRRRSRSVDVALARQRDPRLGGHGFENNRLSRSPSSYSLSSSRLSRPQTVGMLQDEEDRLRELAALRLNLRDGRKLEDEEEEEWDGESRETHPLLRGRRLKTERETIRAHEENLERKKKELEEIVQERKKIAEELKNLK